MDVWFSLALPGLLLDLAPILDGKGQNSLSGSCLEDAREFETTALHISVSRFLEMSENRSTSARVRK